MKFGKTAVLLLVEICLCAVALSLLLVVAAQLCVENGWWGAESVFNCASHLCCLSLIGLAYFFRKLPSTREDEYFLIKQWKI